MPLTLTTGHGHLESIASFEGTNSIPRDCEIFPDAAEDLYPAVLPPHVTLSVTPPQLWLIPGAPERSYQQALSRTTCAGSPGTWRPRSGQSWPFVSQAFASVGTRRGVSPGAHIPRRCAVERWLQSSPCCCRLTLPRMHSEFFFSMIFLCCFFFRNFFTLLIRCLPKSKHSLGTL